MRTLALFIILITMPMTSQAQLNNPRGIPFQWKTDTSSKTVQLSEITMVLPRHSFPAIDFPDFMGQSEGLQHFLAEEPVIAVAIDGQAKAYPLNMLTMHEISNDRLAGVPILSTYCPLCNASVVYDRRLTYGGETQVLEFEVSGMLRHSDMVMADQQTESWWQQLTGTAIVGELAGKTLDIIPSQVIALGDFFERYPDGLVLSPDTGTDAEAQYGQNPYEHYDASAGKPYARYFEHERIDERLPAMERVVDVRGKDGYRIYPFSVIAEQEVINDTYDGQALAVFYKSGMLSVLDEREVKQSKDVGMAAVFEATLEGQTLTFKKENGSFVDLQTGSSWDITGRCTAGQLKGKQLRPVPHSNHFAFAWLNFHPDSEVYKP